MRRPIGFLVLGLVLWAGALQAFFTKSFSPLAVPTTMFGRKHRTSKRPPGYNARSRSRSCYWRELYFSFRDDQAHAL
jgi:hypothetical protein